MVSLEEEMIDWKRNSVRLQRMILQSDIPKVLERLDEFLETLKQQPLLYVPLSKGGDPEIAATTRSLQQQLRELVRGLPRLGLLREAVMLLETARACEVNFPVGQWAITEFDRLFETGLRAITEQIVATADTEEAQNDDLDFDTAADELVDDLQFPTEALLRLWLKHSQSVRLSSLEKLIDPTWEEIYTFIKLTV